MTQITTGNSGLPTFTAVRIAPSLAPKGAASQVFAQAGMKLDFAGRYQFEIPYLASMPEPVFVGEGGAYPVVQGTLVPVICGPAKKSAS